MTYRSCSGFEEVSNETAERGRRSPRIVHSSNCSFPEHRSFPKTFLACCGQMCLWKQPFPADLRSYEVSPLKIGVLTQEVSVSTQRSCANHFHLVGRNHQWRRANT
ncbi:hypothetical protein AOLI_G00116100 [Acnodon oligacanthus]